MFRKVRQIRLGARFARLRVLFDNFQLDSRGNVAAITALAVLPMVAAIGCAIDYSNASMIRTKLQAAADAAVLATISVNSPVVATSKSMTAQRSRVGRFDLCSQFFQCKFAGRLHQRDTDGHRDADRNDGHRRAVVFDLSFHLLHGSRRLSEHHYRELIHSELHAPHIHRFLSDARCLGVHELPVDDRGASKTAGGQS